MRLPDLPPRPVRRWLGLTVASTVLGMALERVIFWMDVAAIGGAIVSLLGGGSLDHIPKASHEIASIARAIPNDVIPPVRMPSIPKPETPPPPSSNYVTTLTGPSTWISGTNGNCMTSIPNGSTATVVMTPCAMATSAGSGGSGGTVTTIGGGGSGGVTNGTVVITYGGER